jgi:hypothetical protein
MDVRPQLHEQAVRAERGVERPPEFLPRARSGWAASGGGEAVRARRCPAVRSGLRGTALCAEVDVSGAA